MGDHFASGIFLKFLQSLRLTFPRAKLRRQIFDRAKSWAKNWAKFWTKFSGHFSASCAVQNDPPKFLPKLLPIYHSMSCHGSCGRNLKISSPRASGAWGAQQKFRNQEKGVLAKGVSVKTSVTAKETKKYPRILAAAVHLALRAPQPREGCILQKPPSKNPLFLVPERS